MKQLHLALERRAARLLDADVAIARAAVALLVRATADDLQILVIERQRRENDPWSGHMALPGGRGTSGERPLDTAIRETHEEIGLDLGASGILIGRLDDVRPSTGGPQIAVAPFVFAVPSAVLLTPNPGEVAKMLWIPLGHLTDPASAAEHLHILPGGDRRSFPAISYDAHVIWGLTYRVLTQFLEVARSIRAGEVS